MKFSQLIDQLINDTAYKSLGYFGPELVLCATIVLLLLLRLFGLDRRIPAYWTSLIGAVASFGCAGYQFVQFSMHDMQPDFFFTGLLVYDGFSIFFRMLLTVFLVLVVVLTILSGIPDDEDGPDFYSLLFGSSIGMMLMCSANNLLMVFLAIEMTSVPSYGMVAFLKGRRKSSEAALKYVVYGAGTAGVMLYGISLIAGLLGTATLTSTAPHVTDIATQLSALFTNSEGAITLSISDPTFRTLLLAVMMVLVGIAFKLSLVPFHFWCPDVFEGAAAEIAGFLSVASKAAAFALLVRFCLAFVGNDPAGFSNLYLALGIGLGVVAAASATFGNLAAYSQTNIKRLLAYSTIAHAGYMLMAVSAMMVLLSTPDTQSEVARSVEGLLYYLTVYLFMNLGAFAIVAFIRNEIFSEEIDDYKGLIFQAPVLCVCMAICMFSLIGMPPFGGFFAKLEIFASIYSAASVHWFMWVVLSFGAINTVFSLWYYVRVLAIMIISNREEDARSADIPANSLSSLYVLTVSIPVMALGFGGPIMKALSDTANHVASKLF